jgi:hypothetical protein
MEQPMADDETTTHVEDYAISATRRHSERYAMNDEIDINEIERAIRPHSTLPVAITMDSILEHRRTTHGDFTDDADLAQGLKSLMRQSKNWDNLRSFQAEALDNMATKIARILSGDPNFPDHWRDLQGFPRLVEERL